MGSALAFWALQRNLGSNMDNHHDEPKENPSDKSKTRSKRTESESSTVSWQGDTTGRRDSAVDTTDDEALEHPQRKEATKPRRFSLDFLFSRKNKDKSKLKEKTKRSQSVAVPSDGYEDEDAHHIREYRYPGITGSEFALYEYFL
ncbi:hypothetical protein Ocin01_00760 [Orchesella cincta]|uniref:Uncharacterized protein n=1 Tax=Orchesella cincta TaxID=48709 RepID=A0A1D2NKX2_ORCCI|nr:hypothetical protein Ocin01_00760 [Orchesella cincta]